MTLLPAIESYINLKRSLGLVFSVDGRILKSFARSLGDIPVKNISVYMCRQFYQGTGSPTRFWERKHQALRGFFKYLIARQYIAISPLPEPSPQVKDKFRPYIYSEKEIKRLLDATAILESKRFPLQSLTYRTLILLLYGAGLRPGEGLRLQRRDFNSRDQVLTIWDTKFFKSRLVPLGTSLTKALKRYSIKRANLPLPKGENSAFFASSSGEKISLNKLEKTFVRLRKHADIQRSPADPCHQQPRLQDLRHSFATNRLVTWYRKGEDVQIRLPLLSTYLGHVNVSGTQTYLTMIPELLTEASQRFEKYSGINQEDYHV